METTKTSTSYTRGPYKPRSTLYRSKVSSQPDNKDCESLLSYISNQKREIKQLFDLSHNRSKILENLQGLEDYLRKQVRRKEISEAEKEKIDLRNKIQKLEETLEFFKEKFEKLEENLYSTENIYSDLLLDEHPGSNQ